MTWYNLVTEGIRLAVDVLDMRMRDRSQEEGGEIGGNNVEGRKEEISASYCHNNTV